MEGSNQAFTVIVSQRATQMLVSHAGFLAGISEPAAERLVSEFERAANSLEQFPHRCPWLRAQFIPPNKYRYLIFEKRYLLIFQIVEKTVYVDYVIDCREDYGWLLR